MIMEALGGLLSRRRRKPKLRPTPQLGGGPIPDRGSRRNMRRIEAVNFMLSSDRLLRAQQRHDWYYRPKAARS